MADKEPIENETSPNRRITAFLFCVILSTVFWFLIVLSKDYNSQVLVPVTYTNLPQNLAVVSHLPKTITVEVKSFGFNLLKQMLQDDIDPITIDCKQLKVNKANNKGFILTNSKLDKINKQLSNNMEVIRITPDTIYFEFEIKSKKTVPVTLIYDLQLEKQYHIADSFKITPALIIVEGPQSIVDTLTTVYTKRVKLANANKTIRQEIDLLYPALSGGIQYSSSKVLVTIPIEKFTETSIAIPIEPTNVPYGYSVKTYPEKTTATYQVSLNAYEEIKPSHFRIVADFSHVDIKKENKVKLEIRQHPAFIKNIKITPDKVEFVLIKR